MCQGSSTVRLARCLTWGCDTICAATAAARSSPMKPMLLRSRKHSMQMAAALCVRPVARLTRASKPCCRRAANRESARRVRLRRQEMLCATQVGLGPGF
jgi:hypothetical protein